MSTMTTDDLETIATKKTELFKAFLAMEPPECNGEQIIGAWKEIYDAELKNTVVDTKTGPSDEETNRVFPYEKLYAVIGDGVPNANWKYPRMWQRFDEIERRGTAFREGEPCNFEQPNKNPNIVPQNILVVGGGPVGLRMAIELRMGGHKVTIFEKRREIMNKDGELQVLGFTNRINRPHMWPFVRNDLERLNGRDFMSTAACYPVFTEPDTSSIGIDELQLLLLKNALMLGVDFRLGVSYDDGKVKTHPKTMKPTWDIDCTYDADSAAEFGKDVGKNVQNFDCLVGCDGPRTAVRDTQSKYLGDVEKRKFMDCVGIVVNVRKVSNKRLREMGFEYGQPPKDMNRTTMVFRDFFDKIRTEADADLENFIYYKAGFHYYVIITPKRANLIKHGLSGRVYTFAAARSRDPTEANAEKEKLKTYVSAVLKAAGIPRDENMPNDGFVDAPNDCMAFDFAECWNTKKAMSFSYPPPDFNTDEHGKWPTSRKLWPYVALAGDSLLEPFWPMGLGLKRGWQAIMDTNYAIDNLFNRTAFSAALGKDPDETSWDDHYTALEEQNQVNFENCNRLRVSEDLGKGEYLDGCNVKIQMNKKMKDAVIPTFEVEVNPWTRYEPLAREYEKEMKKKFLEDGTLHPIVAKAQAKAQWYHENTAGGGKGELQYHGKTLVTMNGKTVEEEKSGYSFKPVKRKSVIVTEAERNPAATPFKLPTAEIQQKSSTMQASLLTAVLSKNVDAHVNSQKTSAVALGRDSSLNSWHSCQETRDEIGHVAKSDADGIAGATENMWDRMNGKHLSPAQGAELEHVRNMISALSKSLDSYKTAEKDLMMK